MRQHRPHLQPQLQPPQPLPAHSMIGRLCMRGGRRVYGWKERLLLETCNSSFCLRVTTGLFFVYLYAVFELMAFISFSLLLISGYMFVLVEMRRCRQVGLIGYLPHQLQHFLTNRSLFDVFTGLWSPNTFIYLKTFYKPFFVHISPQDAVETLEELPPRAKSQILTKGIVYSLPACLQQVLLPQTVFQGNKPFTHTSRKYCFPHTTDIQREQEFERSLMEIRDDVEGRSEDGKRIVERWGVQEEEDKRSRRGSSGGSGCSSGIFEDDSLNSRMIEGELERIGRKSHFAFPPKLSQSSLPASTSYERSRRVSGQASQTGGDGDGGGMEGALTRELNRAEMQLKRVIDVTTLEIPTKVIASSLDQTKRLGEKGSSNSEVDARLARMFQSVKRHINNASSDSTIGQIKSALSIISGVAEIKKNSSLLQKLDGTRAYKVFALSTVFLLSQYFISKKTRRWLISSTMLAAYIVSFFLTFGSLGVFIMKRADAEEKEQKKNLQGNQLQIHPQQMKIKDSGSTKNVKHRHKRIHPNTNSIHFKEDSQQSND